MYCKNCGNKLEENHTFCARCGCSVNSVGAARAESAPVSVHKASDSDGETIIWKTVSICNLVIGSLMLLCGLIAVIAMCSNDFVWGNIVSNPNFYSSTQLGYDFIPALIISVGGAVFSGAVAAVCLGKKSCKIINLITIGLSALFFVLLAAITVIAAMVS